MRDTRALRRHIPLPGPELRQSLRDSLLRPVNELQMPDHLVGPSTRFVGAIVMTHATTRPGPPPRLAPIQMVIVPISE